jgi:DNA-binding transcriptional MerR regulator
VTTTGRYHIAEIASRSGFSAPTLRYYEEIGLLPAADRGDNGYRIYDDATLDRLRFIARAKQLGCSLDEIAELTTSWESGLCAPVQGRLQALVDAKIGATLDRVEVPIACTLGGGEMEGRLEDWRAALAEVVERVPLADGVRLELGPGAEVQEVTRLAAAEQDCCRFFGFAVVIDHRGTALEVHAPPDAQDLVTAVFGAPALSG